MPHCSTFLSQHRLMKRRADEHPDASASKPARTEDQRSEWDVMAVMYAKTLQPAFAPIHRFVIDHALHCNAKDILDFGCGPGALINTYCTDVDTAVHVVGVDTSAAMVAVAEKAVAVANDRARVHLLASDNVPTRQELCSLLPSAGTESTDDDGVTTTQCYDFVSCVQVMQYLKHEQRVATLRVLAASTRPGGSILTITWGPRHSVAFLDAVKAMHGHVGGEASEDNDEVRHDTTPPAPDSFALSSLARLRQLEASVDDVVTLCSTHSRVVDVAMPFQHGVRQLAGFAYCSSVLRSEQLARMRAEVEKRISLVSGDQALGDDAPLQMPARVVIGLWQVKQR